MVPSTATEATLVNDAELLDAYRATVWTVDLAAGTADVRLGEPADTQLRPSGIVTAYNPASIARTPDENRAADQELLRHVRSLGVPFRRTMARGTAPGADEWEEPGFLLLGDVRPLLVELGLVFGQNAVVWVDATGAVSLVCTRARFADRLPGQKIEL
ncbi:MAG TPA: DUF3293 domain-containing protein [Longimicrobium sp.]|uniref:DUF3293 domain-containing protein n=1 Tax=Longimicrobium sp. TaxID=2029185 RepID=UPI002EDB7656